MDVHLNHIILIIASCLGNEEELQELHGQQASIMLSSLKTIILFYRVTLALLCRKKVFIVGTAKLLSQKAHEGLLFVRCQHSNAVSCIICVNEGLDFNMLLSER